MKKKLVAFLVLIIAICSLFTACVTASAPKAADSLTYNGVKVQVSETKNISVSNATTAYNFTADGNFKVSNGFTMQVYNFGASEAISDITNVALNEGENKYTIKVVYNSNSSNTATFTVKITRNYLDSISFYKVVDNVVAADPVMPAQSKERGTTFTVPAAPAVGAGERFDGWFLDQACITPAGSSFIVSGPTSLYAKITITARDLPVVVYKEELSGGHSTAASGQVSGVIGNELSQTQLDTITSTYSYEGFEYGNYVIEGDVVKVYYNRKSYTVNFYDEDGETLLKSETLKYGAAIAAPTEPTKASDKQYTYSFAGWTVDGSAADVAATVDKAYDYVASYTGTDKVYTIVLPETTLEEDGYTLTADVTETTYNGGMIKISLSVNPYYSDSMMNSLYTINMNGVDYTLNFSREFMASVPTVAMTGMVNEFCFPEIESGDVDELVFTVEGLVPNTYNVSAENGDGYTFTVPSTYTYGMYNMLSVSFAIADDYNQSINNPPAILANGVDVSNLFTADRQSLPSIVMKADILLEALVELGVDVTGGIAFTAEGVTINKYDVTVASSDMYTAVVPTDAVAIGEEYTVKVTVDEHYEGTLVLKLNGEAVITTASGNEYTYTGTMTNAGAAFTVEGLEAKSYDVVVDISALTDVGESTISPMTQSVKYGSEYTITLTVADGYRKCVDDGEVVVKVNGTNVTGDIVCVDETNYVYTYTGVCAGATTVTVTGIKADGTTYKFEHYNQNAEGTGYNRGAADTNELFVEAGAELDETEVLSYVRTDVAGYTYNNYVVEGTVIKFYYNRNVYIVRFLDEDGVTEIDKQTLKHGETVYKPSNPTKADVGESEFTFVGWTVDGDIVEVSTSATATVDYIAKYEESTKTYDLVLPSEAEQIGYTLTADVTNGVLNAPYVLTLTVDAEYSKNPAIVKMGDTVLEFVDGKYTGAFSAAMQAVTVEVKQNVYNVTLPAEMNGYNLIASTNSGISGTQVRLTLSLNQGYDECINDVVVALNGTQKTLDGEYSLTFTLTEDTVVTVTGVQANEVTYTVTHIKQNVNGNYPGSGELAEIKYRGILTEDYVLANAVNEYEGFEVPTVTISGLDVTLKYARKTFDVTFVDEDDSELATNDNVRYGAKVTAPGDPTKASVGEVDYTFAGWSDGENVYSAAEINAKVVEATVTYKATYTAKTREYTLNLSTGAGYTLTVSDNKLTGTAAESYTLTVTLDAEYTETAPTMTIAGQSVELSKTSETVYTYTANYNVCGDVVVTVTQNVYQASYSAVTGATIVVTPASGVKGTSYTVTVTVLEGYQDSFDSVTVTVGGVTATNKSGNVITYTGTYSADVEIVVTGVEQDANNYVIQIYTQNETLDGYEMTSSKAYVDEDTFDAADIAIIEATVVEGYTIDKAKSVNNIETDGTYAIYYNRNAYEVTYDVNGAKTTEEVKYGLTLKNVPTVESYEDGETVYTFKEWTVGGVKFDVNSAITDSITLVATYSSATKTYELVVPADQVGYTIVDLWTGEPLETAEFAKGDFIEFEVLVDTDNDYSQPTAVKVNGITVEAEDDVYVVDITDEFINAEGKIVITVEGVAIKTYTVSVPESPVGYTIDVESTGNTKGSVVTLTIAKDGDYDLSAMVVKANGTTINAADGVYTFTLNENTIVTVDGVKINTYTVKSAEGAGYTISDIETTNEDGLFVKGATVNFKVTIDPDYNRSLPVVNYAITGTAATKLATKVSEGNYSMVIDGNTTISVTNLAKNSYTITGSPKVVNTSVKYPLINSLTGATLYVNGAKTTLTSTLNLTVESNETTSIVYKASDGTILYSNDIVIEAGGEDVDLGTIYLGYYTLDGYTAKADGQYSDPETFVDAWMDKVNGNFIAEYTVYTDMSDEKRAEVEAKTYTYTDASGNEVTAAKGLEEDPCYGFSIYSQASGKWMQVMFHATGVRILTDSGWDKRVEAGDALLLPNTALNLASGKGLNIKMVRYNSYFYFYNNDVAMFALSETDGLTLINDPKFTLSETFAKNNTDTLIPTIKSIINQTDIKYSIVATFDSGKELHNRVSGFYYADINDGVDTSFTRNFGSILFEDGYDPDKEGSGGTYMITWPNAAEKDVSGYEESTGYYLQDLNSYEGVLDNRTITVRFTSSNYDNGYELSKAFLYKRAKGSTGDWTAVGDVYGACTYDTNKNYYYVMSIESGYDYKFDLDYAIAAAQTTVTAVIRLEGSYIKDLNFEIFNRTIDGEKGTRVESGTTVVETDDSGKEVSLVKYLKAGAYKFVLHGGQKAYGVVCDFDISGEQASLGTVVSIGEFDLEANIFGDNISGAATTEFDTTSKENYSVTITGANPYSAYILKQDIGDGEIISYSMKFNKYERAHGLLGATGDNGYYNSQGNDSDTYYKNAIDYDLYLQYAPHEAADEPQRSSFLGLRADGSLLLYSYGQSNNKSPFVDIQEQLVTAQNYDLTYDLVYYRIRENGVPYVYLLAKYGTDATYTVMGKHEAGFTFATDGVTKVYSERSTLRLAISGISGFYQNYTYRNLVWSNDTAANAALFEEALKANVPTGPVGKSVDAEGNVTYEATMLGNGGAYIGDVVGDKTKGIFTIEADIESYTEWTTTAYNVYGLMLIDPVTGKRVHMGPANDTAGAIYISLSQTGNGWDYRLKEPANKNIGGIDVNHASYVNFGYDGTNATTHAFHYIKAVIEGDNWKLYVGPNADAATLVWSGNAMDAFKDVLTMSGKSWSVTEDLYPTAENVAVGIYTFSDGKNYAKYSNIKVSYQTYVDINKPTVIDEVLAYASDKGVFEVDEDHDIIVAISNANTDEALAAAEAAAYEYIDFIAYRTEKASDLDAWVRASHDGYNTEFVMIDEKMDALMAATTEEAVDAAFADAQCAIAIVAATADFDVWYADKSLELADAIAAGDLTATEVEAAEADARAIIATSKAFEDVLTSLANAKNAISGLLDSEVTAAKNSAIAAVDAITATTTEYGQAELDAAKASAKLTINGFATADEVTAAQADIVAAVQVVATKVSTVYETVSFTVDGTAVTTLTNVTYGTVITVADATKAATAQYTYTFKEWTVDGKAVTNVIADTIVASFNTTVNSYTVTVTDGTGYTITSSESAAEYGTEVILTIVLGANYSQSIPTVEYAAGKTATLVTAKEGLLTYKFTLDCTANVIVSGITENVYEIVLNTNIIRGQTFSPVTASAKVDLYVNDALFASNVSNNTYRAAVGVGTHDYEFRIGSTVVYQDSAILVEGGQDYTKEVFVGYNRVIKTANYTYDAEGIHNTHLGEQTAYLVDETDSRIMVAAGANFVATATFVDGLETTETDQGHGFGLYIDDTRQLNIRWIRQGFRIEYKDGTWATRVAEESKIYRSSSLQGNNGTVHKITLVRYNKVYYLYHDDVLEAKFDATNGFVGITATDSFANDATFKPVVKAVDEAAISVTSVVNFDAAHGAVQYTTYKDLGLSRTASEANSYALALLRSDVDAFVATEVNNVMSGYSYTPTASDLSAITSPTAQFDAALTSAKNTIMANAVASFKTQALAEIKSYAGVSTLDSAITADLNAATTVKGVATGIANAKSLIDASCTVSGKITSKVDGAAISGATVSVVVGSATFSTTTNSSGNYSLLVGCGTATVNVKATGYAPAAVPADFSTAGAKTQNIVLAKQWFVNGDMSNVTVSATKTADASDSDNVAYDLYSGGTSTFVLATDKVLVDGGTVSYFLKYNGASGEKLADSYRATTNAIDKPYNKNVVGGVGVVLNGNGCFSGSDAYMSSYWKSGFWTKNANVFDFGNGMAMYYAPNYDLMYGIMYARQGTTVYVYGAWGNTKFGITDGWTLMGTADISVNGHTASTAVDVAAVIAHNAGTVVNATYSHVQVTTNGAAAVIANGWDYKNASTCYAGTSRYDLAEGETYHRYDAHLNLTQQAKTAGSWVRWNDASFNTNSGTLTVNMAVDVEMTGVTNNCEAFGLTLTDGTNYININQMKQASGTLQLDTTNGGNGGTNRIRLLSTRDTGWAEAESADNYGIYYVNNDVIPALESGRFQGNIKLEVAGTVATMYWNNTMVFKADLAKVYWNQSGTRPGESSGTAEALTTTFDWTKVKVGVRLYHDGDNSTTKGHKVYFSNVTRTFKAN